MTAEQNPELLHWRANVLLDEMMLGAIDLAASDSVPARALAPRQQNTHVSTSDARESATADAMRTNTSFATAAEEAGARVDSQEHARQWQPTADDHRSSAQARQGGAPDKAAAQPRGRGATSAGERPKPANGTEQWLFAAEQRYEQIAARRQASQGVGVTEAGYEYDGWSMAADPTGDQGFGGAAAYGAENYDAPNASYGTAPGPKVAPAAATSPNKGTGTSGTAPKNGRKSLRSNLLPRMNALDSQTVQQEMGMLQNAIEGILPAAHESRTRAQHLLQKAYTLVQTDPTRSAEVDYYLQQVRTIMQRAQETVHWSTLYQNRLRTYLLAWLALGSIVILSRYLYAVPLSNWLARLSGQSNESLWVYNILTITSAFFFGALGGGSGALFTMVQHRRLGQAFFDRKYSLRGLILPLIGALFGVGLCVLFGLFYALFGLDPGSNFLFGLLPALLAFALGASQDYLYGTHES